MKHKEYGPSNAPAWLTDYMITRSEVCRRIGMTTSAMHCKITGKSYNRFTPTQLEALDRERLRLLIMLATN